MRRSVLALFLFTLLAHAGAAQEAVEIKFARPVAGSRTKVTVEEKTVTKSVYTVNGMTQGKDEVKSKLFVYVDDIIETSKDFRRPTKSKRTYEKAVIGGDGKDKKLGIEGKTVLIEQMGEKYSFTVDGKPVDDDSLKILSEEFDRPEGHEVRNHMLPKQAIKVGEAWTVDSAELAKSIGERGLVFAKDKLSAGGKLVKAYKKDGRQYGVIELVFDAPITGLGNKNPIVLKDARMTMKLSGDGCIDGTLGTGKSTSKMTVTLEGSVKNIDVKAVIEGTESRTVEELPKK
jgi:hypothetical protein